MRSERTHSSQEEERPADIFLMLGGEEGCRRLSRAFYGRVAKDPVLKPLFPGKSLRCATEELSAFLVQFFGGDESQSQYRWWLSLRESHARFQISESHRSAWILRMNEALRDTVPNVPTREALGGLFVKASQYILGQEVPLPDHPELAALWRRQLQLEDVARCLANGADAAAILSAEEFLDEFSGRRSTLVGILAKMVETGRKDLIDYAIGALDRDPDLRNAFFNGRPLLHFAAGSGCLEVVRKLLVLGQDPNIADSGGPTALYRAASHRTTIQGPEVVTELIAFGASVNLCGGVNRSTALHEAARHGNVSVAKVLIDAGADVNAKDARGLTPLDRALNCRRREVAVLLSEASQTS